MKKKETTTANFPGIGKIEITKERTEQIKRLQKLIKENNKNKTKPHGKSNKT